MGLLYQPLVPAGDLHHVRTIRLLSRNGPHAAPPRRLRAQSPARTAAQALAVATLVAGVALWAPVTRAPVPATSSDTILTADATAGTADVATTGGAFGSPALSGGIADLLAGIRLWLDAAETGNESQLLLTGQSIAHQSAALEASLPAEPPRAPGVRARTGADGYVRAALTYLRPGLAAGDTAAVLRAQELLLLASR